MITRAGKKETYGLLSKTILTSLVNENLSKESLEAFCLYMHWGIINSFPGRVLPQKELTEVILQWISLQEPSVAAPAITGGLQEVYNSKSEWISYVRREIDTPAPALAGYKRWEQHCRMFFQQNPSLAGCLQLMMILKDCIPLMYVDTYAAVYMIHESLRAR